MFLDKNNFIRQLKYTTSIAKFGSNFTEQLIFAFQNFFQILWRKLWNMGVN